MHENSEKIEKVFKNAEKVAKQLKKAHVFNNYAICKLREKTAQKNEAKSRFFMTIARKRQKIHAVGKMCGEKCLFPLRQTFFRGEKLAPRFLTLKYYCDIIIKHISERKYVRHS